VRAVAAVFVLMFVVMVSSSRKEGSGLFSEAGMMRGRRREVAGVEIAIFGRIIVFKISMTLHIHYHFCGEELLCVSIGTSLKLNAESLSTRAIRRARNMLSGFAERISYFGICLPNSDISWGKESLFHARISKIPRISHQLAYKEDGMGI
jgi:hypothetical protein